MIVAALAILAIGTVSAWMAAVAAWSLATYAANAIDTQAFNDPDTDLESEAA